MARVPDLAAAAAAHEPPELVLGRAAVPGSLLLERPERPQVSMPVDDALDLVRAESADELVLEVGVADEEPEPLQVRPGQGGAETRALEAAGDVTLLAGVVEPGQRDVEAARTVRLHKAPDRLRAADRNDFDPFCREVAAAAQRERLQRDPVALALDEDDGIGILGHALVCISALDDRGWPVRLWVIESGDSTSGATTVQNGQANPRIAVALLLPAFVQGAVIAGAGVVLFFAPTTGHDIWGWELTPFNTRFLGAIYLAALVDFVALAVVRRWIPARLVIPMDFLFMSVILVVSVAYVGRFDWEQPVTWAWFFIFVSVPIYAAAFLWRFRGLWRVVPSVSERPSERARLGLVAVALLLAGYGVGLVIAPETFTGFWPWPIDGFHARVYSAIFLSLALASALLTRTWSPLELSTLGLTCVALGVLEPVGLLVVDADVDKVAWSSSGTWAWIAIFAALCAYGLVLVGASLRQESAVPRAAPA